MGEDIPKPYRHLCLCRAVSKLSDPPYDSELEPHCAEVHINSNNEISNAFKGPIEKLQREIEELMGYRDVPGHAERSEEEYQHKINEKGSELRTILGKEGQAKRSVEQAYREHHPNGKDLEHYARYPHLLRPNFSLQDTSAAGTSTAPPWTDPQQRFESSGI